MIQRTLYVLADRDLEKSAAFYRDVIGFEVREVGDPGWRMFVRDGCRIMAGECLDALPARELGDHSYFAYFVDDDVDAFHAAVRPRRAQTSGSSSAERAVGMPTDGGDS